MTSIFKIQFLTEGAPDPTTVVLLFKGETYEEAREHATKIAKQRKWALKQIEEKWVNRAEPRWKPNQISRANRG